MKRKWIFSMLAAGVLTGGLVNAADAPKKPAPAKAAPAQPAKPADPFAAYPEILAEVNGKKVSKKEVVDFLISQMPDKKLPEMLNAETVKMLMPGLVKSYVDQPLLSDAAAKAGFKPSPEMVKNLMNQQLKELQGQQLDMLKQQLAMSGKTLESYIEEIAKKPEAQKQAAFEMYVKTAVMDKVKVTDAEVKDFYDKNQNQFKIPADTPEVLRASHILIKVDAKATQAEKDKALQKAKELQQKITGKPADFETIAKAESACPSGRMGGSLGAFRKGQMVKEFEAATLALAPGQITKEPVKTQFGYHIIRRDQPQKESMEPFIKVKGQIAEFLKARKGQQAMLKLVNDLEAANKVKFFVEMPKEQK